MRNDTKSVITITMRNVDQAVKLKNALEKFFSIADAGGDTEIMHSDGNGAAYAESCGIIGHDVRRADIELVLHPDSE